MAKLGLDITERSGLAPERFAWGYENYRGTHEESQNNSDGIRIKADLPPKLHRPSQRSEPGQHCSNTIVPADTPESAKLQTESKRNLIYQQNTKVTRRSEKQVDRHISADKPTPQISQQPRTRS
jgi:hypothetical protein